MSRSFTFVLLWFVKVLWVRVAAKWAVHRLFCRACGDRLVGMDDEKYPYCSDRCADRHWVWMSARVLQHIS